MKKDKTKSQLSCLAVENIEYYENITKQNLSLKMKNIRIGKADNNTKTLNTMQTLSSLFGVSERYIADAKKLYKLDVELFNKVRTGTITLSKAIKDYAILQKLDTINKDVKTNIDVELTKADIKKINELVKELHITETKAKDYIIKKKLEKLSNIRTNPKTNKIEYKEIKFRISENDKAKLQTIAKDKKTTLAELLRDILSKKLK